MSSSAVSSTPVTTSTANPSSTGARASAAASPSASSSPAIASSSVAVPSPAASSSISSLTVRSSASSSSSRSTSSSISAVNADSESSSIRRSGPSGGTIGGIVGGAVGGLVVLLLLWTCWRRRRDRKDRVPPPPPREMLYPQSHRQRVTSSAMLAGGGGAAGMQRASSYSTLLNTGPSSTYASHSRQYSYYNAYPVETPSANSHETSPPMALSDSSPPLTEISTPKQEPTLQPINTSLRRDGSTGSFSGSSKSGNAVSLPRNKSYVDRLRQQPTGSSLSRAPSPSGHSEGDTSSGATSPIPQGQSRLSMSGLSRPYSSMSMSSRHLHPASSSGAPHRGRHVEIELPRKLGASPDPTGDFFWGKSKPSMEGLNMDFAGPGQRPEHIRTVSRAATEMDFGPPSPRHARVSSLQSLPARPRASVEDIRSSRLREESGAML